MNNLNDNFWSKVDKTDYCWNWTGGKSRGGYGRFKIDGKLKSVTRLIMSCTDPKLDVCHKCDNPSCINPEHLFLGTRKENMLDAVSKGRIIPHNKIYSSQKERRAASWKRYYAKHGKELQARRKIERSSNW